MAEMIGTITNIKLASFAASNPSSIDVGAITLLEASSGASWVFYIWNSRDTDSALQRVLQTQRLALVREAALHKLTVHVFHENDSSILFEITVDFP